MKLETYYRNYNYFFALQVALGVPCGLSPLVYIIGENIIIVKTWNHP